MLHDSNSIFFTSSLQKRKTVSGKKRAICYALPLFFTIFAEDINYICGKISILQRYNNLLKKGI